jgi:hypothetical protein
MLEVAQSNIAKAAIRTEKGPNRRSAELLVAAHQQDIGAIPVVWSLGRGATRRRLGRR